MPPYMPLMRYSENIPHVLKNVEDIGFSFLDNKDVVRHPLVQRIVNAYEKDEAKRARRR